MVIGIIFFLTVVVAVYVQTQFIAPRTFSGYTGSSYRSGRKGYSYLNDPNA